jgi:hypothetical protein
VRYLSDLLIASTVALATAFAGAALTASGPELGAFAELPPVGTTLAEVQRVYGVGVRNSAGSSQCLAQRPWWVPPSWTRWQTDYSGPLTCVSVHYFSSEGKPRVEAVRVHLSMFDLPGVVLVVCATFGLAVAVLSRRVRRCA